MTQPWIEGRIEESVMTTTLEDAINWSPVWERLADDVRFGLLCH